MTEKEARAAILKSVAQYCKTYHNKETKKRINYAGRVYDEREMVNLVDSALEFYLTSARYTDEFERRFGEYIGVKYTSFVNSGSSANLLAFMALTSPLMGDRAIKRGDEVITVAAAFPTTVAPIIQFGACAVFIDVTIGQYNVDVSLLESALSDKTRAVMLAHTLGNPFDIAAVRSFCDKHGLWLIEDNCDALGSEYTLNGQMRKTGTFGDVATSSFYPPHHMTTGEGGAVYTDNPLISKAVRSLRDWGRDCVCPSGQDNACRHRFDTAFARLPKGYDHKYVYSHFGYNLKATDMQAAIGCAQLDKLNAFTHARRENFKALRALLAPLEEYLILPENCRDSLPSPFGFPMTVQQGLQREKIVRYLEDSGIQTRMLFSGNLCAHPCFDALCESDFRQASTLANTDRIMRDTFWVGVYPGMSESDIQYMAKTIAEAVRL
ncbi:MAG: lipopolysaccharide biosynthesis protein RfbH [Clostridia bacterium]|nr:lipopolysaccharide biosynthesis protein RfbH [Clostridia bacterium]